MFYSLIDASELGLLEMLVTIKKEAMNNLTLFHTTTDFYLPSILESGLGGINPNKELGIYNYLISITPLCNKYLLNDKRYLNIQYLNDSMVKQTSYGNMSFTHDKIHLATDTSTAIQYSRKKFGSELLTRVIFLSDLLTEAGYEKEIDKSELKIDLNYVKRLPHKKIILMIEDIKIEEIETENGENAKDKLDVFEIMKKTDPEIYEKLKQQLNFRLLKPISIDRIKAADVDKYNVDIDMVNLKSFC